MAKECKSPEELYELAASEGVELTDEDLDTVSGGWEKKQRTKYTCKSCGGDVEWQGPQKRYVCKVCKKDKMYPCDLNTVQF